MQKPKSAFVLGAGLGTRLRPLTDSTPKPMLTVRGKPNIEYIFDSLIDAGVEKIVVNTHHAAEAYARHFCNMSYRQCPLVFVHEAKLLDTGGGLKNIVPHIDKESGLIVYNGDIFSKINVAKFLDFFANQTDADAALVLRAEGAIKNVAYSEGFVRDMRGILGVQNTQTAQFSGIFACRGSFLELLEKFDSTKFSTVEVFIESIKRKPNSVCAYFDNSQWSDIGTPEEYYSIQ